MSQGKQVVTQHFRGSGHEKTNLAVQTSVRDLLDEFTEIISGELQYHRPIEDNEPL